MLFADCPHYRRRDRRLLLFPPAGGREEKGLSLSQRKARKAPGAKGTLPSPSPHPAQGGTEPSKKNGVIIRVCGGRDTWPRVLIVNTAASPRAGKQCSVAITSYYIKNFGTNFKTMFTVTFSVHGMRFHKSFAHSTFLGMFLTRI